MEKKILFLVFCPPSIRAGGGAKCGLGFAKTIFWGKDLAKHSANIF